MKKNVAGQFVQFQLILRASGNDAVGLSPTVSVNINGAGWVGGAGVIKEGQNGAYEYAPSQAETNGNHIAYQMTATGAITQLINVYPVTVSEYQADVSGLSTFDASTDEVTTDAASRTASQADVSNLIAKGQIYRWTNTGSGTQYDIVTITDEP